MADEALAVPRGGREAKPSPVGGSQGGATALPPEPVERGGELATVDLQKPVSAIAASLFPSLLEAIPLNAILGCGSEGYVWVHVSPESEEV